MALLSIAETSVVDAEGPSGPAFKHPGIVWPSVTSDWIERPVVPRSQVQEADLVISLDQQLYPYLLPLIQDYGTTHGQTIAVSKGTCGISAGLLFRKAVDIGGFCCPPADRDGLPGLRFHTLAIAAIARRDGNSKATNWSVSLSSAPPGSIQQASLGEPGLKQHSLHPDPGPTGSDDESIEP